MKKFILSGLALLASCTSYNDEFVPLENVDPIIEYRNDNFPEKDEIQQIIYRVNSVPSVFNLIINESGNRLVFFDGVLTDQEEARYKKGLKIPTWDDGDYDSLRGFSKGWIHLVGIDGKYHHLNMNVSSIALHEWGHAFDSAVGYCFYDHPISKLDLFVDYAKFEDYSGLNLKHFTKPNEVVAGGFEDFYYSKESRRVMRLKDPLIYNFFDNLNKTSKKQFKELIKEGHKPNDIQLEMICDY